jgi:hypothetical protein
MSSVLHVDALALAARASLGRRVRFSALDACTSHLCVGANTGSLYCFATSQWSLTRVVPFSSFASGASEPVDFVKFRFVSCFLFYSSLLFYHITDIFPHSVRVEII